MQPNNNQEGAGINTMRLVRGIIYSVAALGVFAFHIVRGTFNPLSGVLVGVGFLAGVFTIYRSLPRNEQGT